MYVFGILKVKFSTDEAFDVLKGAGSDLKAMQKIFDDGLDRDQMKQMMKKMTTTETVCYIL